MPKTTPPAALVDLARCLLDEADLPSPAAEFHDGAAFRPALALDELIADGSGELVLDAQGHLDLRADSEVVARGEAQPHLTSGGEDVSGLTYVAFASGVTLYYPSDLDLNVIAGGIG